MFSSRSFIVSGLTFRSLIHFKFIFVYGVRKCSSFILLQVVDQFFQHHLLKWLSLFPLYILASFVEDKVSIGSWIYLWAFYSVPLICISVFVPVLWPLLNFPKLLAYWVQHLTALSFRPWISSVGIPSPPPALFVVMLHMILLTSDSRMSGCRWEITPLWLSGSLRSFLYSLSVYSLFFWSVYS